jgi:hypothetical protein
MLDVWCDDVRVVVDGANGVDVRHEPRIALVSTAYRGDRQEWREGERRAKRESPSERSHDAAILQRIWKVDFCTSEP